MKDAFSDKMSLSFHTWSENLSTNGRNFQTWIKADTEIVLLGKISAWNNNDNRKGL